MPSESTSLRQRVLRAGIWSIAGYGLAQAIRLGGNLVMTRLLAPEMFGVMAIATMVYAILFMLSDIGLRQNIVQSQRGDDPAFLDTAWTVQIARGVALWITALLISAGLYFANAGGLVPAHSAYASPELPLVIAIHSLAAVIFGFQSTKLATAHRHFEQRQLIKIELAGQVLGLIVMVAFGVMSRSIWAIVAGGLVASLVSTVFSHTWMRGHSNRFRCEKSALRELVDFGKWIFISSAASILAINGDRLLLAGFVDANELGLYAIAVLIIGSIEGALSKLFIMTSFPAMSEIFRKDPSRLREVYYRFRVPSDLFLLFVAGLLFATGQIVIDLLYDPRYSAAGGILQILALSLFTVRYGVALKLYVAVGIPRYQAIINVVRFVSLYTLVPSLYYMVGTQAAIWGIALHALATLPFVYYFSARLGVNDYRKELMVLGALPVGYLCGYALSLLRS